MCTEYVQREIVLEVFIQMLRSIFKKFLFIIFIYPNKNKANTQETGVYCYQIFHPRGPEPFFQKTT